MFIGVSRCLRESMGVYGFMWVSIGVTQVFIGVYGCL